MQAATLQPGSMENVPVFEVFDYPAVPGPPLPSWEAFGSSEPVAFGSGASMTRPRLVHDAEEERRLNAAFEARLAEEVRRAFETGKERGFEEGRAAERDALADGARAKDEGRIEQAARLAERFDAERERYFEAVEPEVVKLALAVAARILRRESQMDALLLSGAVRVALGQLSTSTQVRLRVPSADLGTVERYHLAPAESRGKANRGCRRRHAAGRVRDGNGIGIGGPRSCGATAGD